MAAVGWMKGDTYLVAPRAFTGDARGLLEDAAILVRGSKIADVIPAAELPAGVPPEAVRRFTDATILPGLIDAHSHLTLAGDRRTYEEMIQDPDELMALIAVRNLQRHLASGVTTLRDNGGRNRVTFVVREAINRGYFVGPRLLLSGRPLTHSHGHFYWCNGVADGEGAIRAAVRKLVAEGADHIKIMASGGATAGNIPYYASYTESELRVAVETAHGLGRLTTAHCRAKDSMENAIAAGLDCIEHAEFLVPGPISEYGGGVASSGVMAYDARVTERLLETETFVSFTLQAGGFDSLLELRSEREHERLKPDAEVRWRALEDYFEMKLAILGSLLRDGMLSKLVISTDAGPFDIEFGHLHYGLELATQAGMTNRQALESATRVAAEACGVQQFVGTIEKGKEADLVVVGGNPVEEIHGLRSVRSVFKGGLDVGPLPQNALLPGVLPKPVTLQC